MTTNSTEPTGIDVADLLTQLGVLLVPASLIALFCQIMRSAHAMLIPLGIALLCLYCTGPAPAAPWSYDNVGIAFASADRSCLSIPLPSLAANSRLHIIEPSSGRALSAIVLAAQPSCIGADTSDSSLHGYEIRFDPEPDMSPGPGIALLVSTTPFRTENGITTTDLDADDHREFFRSCTSSEGLHFTIWSDSALSGTRKWHRYHPLGYDVVPNCSPRETDSGEPGR